MTQVWFVGDLIIGEQWRPIACAPGYEISNIGRVKSVARTALRHDRWGGVHVLPVRERILKTGKREGYVMTSVHVGDEQRTIWVHQQVMAAFGPPRPFATAEIRHLNDVRDHNWIGNLAWGTRKENMADARRNGRNMGGDYSMYKKKKVAA